jgi:hypothetical protein
LGQHTTRQNKDRERARWNREKRKGGSKMAVIVNSARDTEFYVVHPLFDEPEEKCDPERLGPMKMTRSVKYALGALRIYLILMVVLACYRVLSMAGLF